jgi:thioredoxin 1
MQFRIRNIPTLLFFKGGEMVNRLVGAVSKQEITAILDSLI